MKCKEGFGKCKEGLRMGNVRKDLGREVYGRL